LTCATISGTACSPTRAEPQVYGLDVVAAIAEDWAAEPLVVEETVRDDVARYAG
jgi:hypothetical protein